MSGEDWRPSATLATLRRRAALLQAVRAFFAARGVLEVDTPILSQCAVTDVQLASLRVVASDGRYYGWLQTSPEFAMKRLLAAGIGDIWQLCRVMRADECGRLHDTEFTMLEWYRVGWTMEQLIDEVAALAEAVCAAAGSERQTPRPVERLRYTAAFDRELGLDPLTAPDAELRDAARSLDVAPATLAALTRDELLDLLMALAVGPRLGSGRWTFLTHYPATQAALARLDPGDPRVAHRFELFAEGIELANGFDELSDAEEQRRRFETDLAERRRRGLPEPPLDARLLAALESGLPECTGVALGFDRLVMLALGASRLAEVVAFSSDRA
jgi:lysyl-tRNA synthetase class 2